MPQFPMKTFEIISSIVICILGTIGNVLVVVVVYRKRKMKTVTNYFIVNLAIADLAVLLINVPLDVAVYFAGDNWLYGGFMCHIIKPLQTLATTASVWSLVAISISRYVAIVHPLKPQLRRTHARWIILPVWAVSLVLVSPYMASLRLKDGECTEDFESAGMVTEYYTLAVFMGQYVVPLVIMAFAYLRVAQELTKNPNHDERTKNHYTETKKVLKMLTIVVLVFAILVLPLHLVFIWKDFLNGGSCKYYDDIESIAILLLYGNSFTNPIIYNACNEEFRKCFRGYFSSWIKPCARLLLGERREKPPNILDDMGSTFDRTQGNDSFRRLSRRDTFTLASANTNTKNKTNYGEKKEKDNNYIKDNTNNQKYRNSRNNTRRNSTVNCHVIFLHKNCINQYHTTLHSKTEGIQFVSVL